MRSQFSREYRLLRSTFDDRCQSSTRSVRARQLLTTVQIISSGSSYVFKPTNISERKRVIEMELFHKTVPHSPAPNATVLPSRSTGMSGVGVFPDGKKSSNALRYCGSPTFRTNSANRGSQGSSKKSVFKPTNNQSCS